MVLLFSDLQKAQIYKIPNRNSPHHEIEINMSFDFLHVFAPDENNKDGKSLFRVEDEKCFHGGATLFSFQTNDELVENFSEDGFHDIKFPFAHGKESIYFMLHQKYIPLQDYEKSTMKDEYVYLYKKNEEITEDSEGIDIVYGEGFLNCKTIHSN